MAEATRSNSNGMGKDRDGHIIQAVPLVQGKVNLSAGDHFTKGVIHCVEAAVVTLTWNDGTTDDIDMQDGEDYSYFGNVTLNGGLFHLC